MKLPRYIIISGYFQHPGQGLDWFHHLWWKNLHKYASPDRVIIISSSNFFVPNAKGEWIVMGGDLGSPEAVYHRDKPFYCSAYPAIWMAGAMLAYLNETDVIFVEQDCLAFGPWVEQIYRELGTRSVLFGKNQMHGAATSLFLVKHRFIPRFVQHYMEQGSEDVLTRMPENKILRLAGRWPEHYGQYSFGYDKDRPLNITDKVWYAQKLTPEDLLQIEEAGLISCGGMPMSVPAFTNNFP